MVLSLTFRTNYWFGETINFNCRGRIGTGVIEEINFLKDGTINYLVYVGEEEGEEFQPGVFENEIIPQEFKNTTYPVTIHPRFGFGQYVCFFRTKINRGNSIGPPYEGSREMVFGNVFGIGIDKDFKIFYQVHIQGTNIHEPGITEKEIMPLM